jgi:outer membrane immunogenic protein
MSKVLQFLDKFLGRQMKKLLVAGIAAAAFWGVPALAADLPTKAPVYKAVPAAAPMFNWSGFYVGGNIGWAWGKSTGSFADPGDIAFANCGPCFAPGFTSPNVDLSKSGFLGGLQSGYNWQLAPTWLVGVEGDITWTGISASSNTGLTAYTAGGLPFAATGSNLNFQTDIRWLASFRGRIGVTRDNWLFYGTGGVAWTHTDFTANATCIGGVCGSVQAPTAVGNTRTGWVAGAGVSWLAPASPWSLSLEYLYYGFNGTNSTSTAWTAGAGCVAAGPCVANYGLGNVTVQTVRVGLNYKFGDWGKAPVVSAKY